MYIHTCMYMDVTALCVLSTRLLSVLGGSSATTRQSNCLLIRESHVLLSSSVETSSLYLSPSHQPLATSYTHVHHMYIPTNPVCSAAAAASSLSASETLESTLPRNPPRLPESQASNPCAGICACKVGFANNKSSPLARPQATALLRSL